MGLGWSMIVTLVDYAFGGDMVSSTLRTVSGLLVGFSGMFLPLNISSSYHKYCNFAGPIISNGDDGSVLMKS